MRTTARHADRRTGTRLMALGIGLALGMSSVGIVAAGSPPANDAVSQATPLALDTPVDFDSRDATSAATDPTDCNGSHGSWPGPDSAPLWVLFTATTGGRRSTSR